MKIAFTTSGNDLDAPLDRSFGKAPRFLVYDLESDRFSVIDNPQCSGAMTASGVHAAQAVARTGARCLVTGQCDTNVRQALCPLGIRLYNTDAPSVSVALAQYRDGHLAADGTGFWWG
jgi:predicted Fe-Mo cluster-binding NifX family protein